MISRTSRFFLLICLSFLLAFPAAAETVKLKWPYNRHFHDELIGYRIYMGTTVETIDQLILDVKKENVTISNEQPILLVETFDTDPGNKYPLAKGSWRWVQETKNMKIETDEFMLVFEKPAGITNNFGFSFVPEKSTGDKPRVLSYIKDESLGAYYELRFAGADGSATSNWRKCYDAQWGGVEGTKALPDYPQCFSGTLQNDLICSGFYILLNWTPGFYGAAVTDFAKDITDTAYGIDPKPLDINKLEILIYQQHGWIDEIVIGGALKVNHSINISLPDTPIYFAVSAYRKNRNDDTKIDESNKSLSVKYETTTDIPIDTKRKPLPTQNMRKIP